MDGTFTDESYHPIIVKVNGLTNNDTGGHGHTARGAKPWAKIAHASNGAKVA